MKLFNVLLLISCLPTIASAQNAAASASSTDVELELKSRASSVTVVDRELHLGHIHILAVSSTDKFKITAGDFIGSNREVGAQVLHALLCHAEVNRGQSTEIRSKFDHLIGLDVDVDGRSKLFGTPLHHAAMLTDHNDSAYFTHQLLKRGALSNIKFQYDATERERTALQIAESNKHEETVELINAYGSPNPVQHKTQPVSESSSDICNIM